MCVMHAMKTGRFHSLVLVFTHLSGKKNPHDITLISENNNICGYAIKVRREVEMPLNSLKQTKCKCDSSCRYVTKTKKLVFAVQKQRQPLNCLEHN